MKKSEVVEVITKILKEDMEPRYLDVHYSDTAVYILNRLEQLGMKPTGFDSILLRQTNTWDKE